ncbi:MAG TPA: glycosyltransferase [Thermoanaerobaculia bacterium]
MRLSILIPVHNEVGELRRGIDPIVKALADAEIAHELLVVDDHSTDGTSDVLELLASRFPTLRSLTSPRPPGLGNAVRAGLDAYTGDAVCITRLDASADPQQIVDYFREIESGKDCAFGSGRTPAGLMNSVIRSLFDLSYDDVTGLFKCYRRTAIDALRPLIARQGDITIELPLKAMLRGCSYAVVPNRSKNAPAASGRGGHPILLLLYLLLEKKLTDGDVQGNAMAPGRRLSMVLPWAALFLVLLYHVVFLKTYPLNYGGGDTPAYYWMLTNRISNLCLAPGYPFLAGFPLGFGWIADLYLKHEAGFRTGLLWAQHLFDLACLAFLASILARLYGRVTAIITIVIAGFSLQAMAVTSSVYPEWLQADFLMLTISFTLLAWHSERFGRKAVWYALAAGTITWAYFVKFNVAVFLPALLLAMLCERMEWRRRVKLAGIAFLFAALNYAGFVGLFHYPKAGTWHLSYDHSWVLMARLAVVYDGKLPYPEGMATKRWLALSGVLPPDYGYASPGPFMNVNSVHVGKGARQKYRQVATQILTATDPAFLDGMIRQHPLPPGFALNISSIPISYYVGLKESDDLGIAVFRESVLHSPGPFVRSTIDHTRRVLHESTIEPLFATTDNVPMLAQSVTPVGSHLKIVPSAMRIYGYGDALVWSPGYHFFSALYGLSAKAHPLLVDLVLLGWLAAIVLGFTTGWNTKTVIPVLLSAMLALFIVVSTAMFEFRWKEMRLIIPLVAMLIGIFGGWTVVQLSHVAPLIAERIRSRRTAGAKTTAA